MKKFSIVVLVCAVSLAASADLELGGFGAMWGATGTENQQMNTLDPTLNEDEKTYSLHQEWSFENNCDLTLDLTYDPDPYVIGGFSVTNTAGFDQSFMFTFTAPVSPALAAPTVYGGSMSGSFTVDGTAGGVSTTAPMPLYMGMIDGAGVLPLYPDPSSWTAPAGGGGDIDPANSPLTNPGPAANTDIAIVYRLTLTPGETATINGNFAVIVPEPATMTLLGLGAVLLGRRKR